MSQAVQSCVSVDIAEDFQGLPTCSVSNGRIRLDVLATGGPRVVRVLLPGVDGNRLAEQPDRVKPTPWGTYSFRGGHRLWHAPEAFPRTYVPDDTGVTLEELEDGVRLIGEPERPTSLRKSLEVRLAPDEASATLTHTIANEGVWEVEVSASAITMLPLGGAALVRGDAPHVSQYAPNRSLVLWPYSRWDDPRLDRLGDRIRVVGSAGLPPLKIGIFSHDGWASYLLDGVVFVKRFEARPDRAHPDRGSNVEIYCGDAFLELETLGPLERLAPGQSTSHVERWEWTTAVGLSAR